MKNNFQDCLNRVLKSEGGYGNDPRDPGGPTNFGITLTDYRLYINSQGTAEDVRRMNVEQAKEIYKTKYWNAVDGDTLPSGVDYTVFDYGVNSGVGRARKVYQRLRSPDPIRTINAINDERISFLRLLSTWPRFGRGWNTRVASVRQYSLKLAKEQPCPTSPTPSLPQPRMPSSTTSSVLSIFKALLTSLQKIFYTVWYRGKPQTPSQLPLKQEVNNVTDY